MKSKKRVKEFDKNKKLEDYLEEINNDLLPAEEKIIRTEDEKYPLIFIVGPLRSGTTLFLQWLARTNEFCYPTNLMSRFFKVPLVGAKIQRLLTDEEYNFRNEIRDFNSPIDFYSENGKTKGALAPNEFWYFWRRFLPFDNIDYVPDKTLLKKVNIHIFKNELLGVSNIFKKPFALKALICNYNIGFLNEVFNKAIFVYTRRNPISNVASVLDARERQTGSRKYWYSFKIPEYTKLKKIDDPVKQVAGQIYFNNLAIKKGLEKVSKEKKLVVEYEDFCDNPKKYYDQLKDKLLKLGYHIKEKYSGPEKFKATRRDFSDEKIEKALNEIKENYL